MGRPSIAQITEVCTLSTLILLCIELLTVCISFIMSRIASHLLVILSYRDTEMRSTHPLMLTISQLEESNCPIIDLQMRSLDIQSITQLISDTIGSTAEQAQPLAELVCHNLSLSLSLSLSLCVCVCVCASLVRLTLVAV
jgi:hypothetical protein